MEMEELVQFEWIDDILICRIIFEKSITKDIAKALVQSRKEFTEGKSVKVVMIFPRLTNMDKGGRDYLSTEDAKEGILASAMVAKTVIGKVIINFFLRLNNKGNDDIPNRVFNTEEEALDWIKNLPLN